MVQLNFDKTQKAYHKTLLNRKWKRVFSLSLMRLETSVNLVGYHKIEWLKYLKNYYQKLFKMEKNWRKYQVLWCFCLLSPRKLWIFSNISYLTSSMLPFFKHWRSTMFLRCRNNFNKIRRALTQVYGCNIYETDFKIASTLTVVISLVYF